jgi:hypothetical protein
LDIEIGRIGVQVPHYGQSAAHHLETFMKVLCALTVLAFAAAGPALAAGGCSNAPKSKWQPKSTLESQLQASGYKIRQIKTEGGWRRPQRRPTGKRDQPRHQTPGKQTA